MTSFRLSTTFFRKFLTFLPVRHCTQQLFYCITLSSVCQEVFQLFLFARLSLISDNFYIVTHCLALVNSFLNFFKLLSAAPRISRTAWLEYQTLPWILLHFALFSHYSRCQGTVSFPFSSIIYIGPAPLSSALHIQYYNNHIERVPGIKHSLPIPGTLIIAIGSLSFSVE